MKETLTKQEKVKFILDKMLEEAKKIPQSERQPIQSEGMTKEQLINAIIEKWQELGIVKLIDDAAEEMTEPEPEAEPEATTKEEQKQQILNMLDALGLISKEDTEPEPVPDEQTMHMIFYYKVAFEKALSLIGDKVYEPDFTIMLDYYNLKRQAPMAFMLIGLIAGMDIASTIDQDIKDAIDKAKN